MSYTMDRTSFLYPPDNPNSVIKTGSLLFSGPPEPLTRKIQTLDDTSPDYEHEIIVEIQTYLTNSGPLAQQTSKLLYDLKRLLRGQDPIFIKHLGEQWDSNLGEIPLFTKTSRNDRNPENNIIQFSVDLASQPKNFEVQRLLHGCTWDEFQKAAYDHGNQDNSPRSLIFQPLLAKLIAATIELQRDFCHGDLKPENIFIEYSGRDIFSALTLALTDPKALHDFIHQLTITFIDLDNSRPIDSLITYPQNGNLKGIGWIFPEGDHSWKNEWLALEKMAYCAFEGGDYKEHSIYQASDNTNAGLVIHPGLIATFFTELKNLGAPSRTDLLRIGRNIGLFRYDELCQLENDSYECRLTLDTENKARINIQLRKLLNAIDEASRRNRNHRDENDRCLFLGSVISKAQLRERLPQAIKDILTEDLQAALNEADSVEPERPTEATQPPRPNRDADPYRYEPWKTTGIVAYFSFTAGIVAVSVASIVAWQLGATAAAIALVCTPVGLIALGVFVLATAIALTIKAVIKCRANKPAHKLSSKSIFTPGFDPGRANAAIKAQKEAETRGPYKSQLDNVSTG